MSKNAEDLFPPSKGETIEKRFSEIENKIKYLEIKINQIESRLNYHFNFNENYNHDDSIRL